VDDKDSEAVIEPDLAICDAHHHLWHHPPPTAYPRYLFDEYLGDIADGHRIESTVFVECNAFYRATGPQSMRPVGETEFANGAAAMAASGRYGPVAMCAGIVSYADLTLGDAVEDVLAAHIVAGDGRLRGIRCGAAHDPGLPTNRANRPPDLYRLPAYRRGISKLAAFGLSFEAWLFHPQLHLACELADLFPDLPIVVDHAGGMLGIGPYAGRQEEVFAVWEAGIRQLALRQNISIKLGGFGMPQRGFGFDGRDALVKSSDLALAWRPYVETCIEAFGVDRAMFESNFPVDSVSCTYRALWNAFKLIASGATQAEKSALFRDTARRFYRLDPVEPQPT
jgi:predicted TIM-barrel fold metal-dependent hydrolase